MSAAVSRSASRYVSHLVLFLALCGSLFDSATAGTFNLFGPRTLTRETTAPITERISFIARDPSIPYEMRITSNSVSSAVITLNGTEIFAASDFKNSQNELSKPVTLIGVNELTVELRGAPGDSLTLSIAGTDNVQPVIEAVASPGPNAAGWNDGDVRVSFNCTDLTSGVKVCPDPILVSAEGAAQVILGTATDNAGNTATASIMVSIDKTQPTVALTDPAAGASVTNAQTVVTGTFSDAISSVTSVLCNETPATLAGGTFSCALSFTEGPNAVRVEATDAAGNINSAATQYVLASTPEVSITEPQNLTFLNLTPITVRGTVTDSSAAVKINGVSAVVSNGTFSVTVPLVEGNNTLHGVARNTLGNVGTDSVQVTLDTTPPRVAITSPDDEFRTADAAIDLAGIVNDIVVGTVNDQQAQITVNGIPAEVANRTWLASRVPLALGPNTIQVIARDRVGNSTTERITVHRVTPTQANIRTITGSNQSGLIGHQLPLPLIAFVANADGTPLPDKPVVFKVIEGNGLVGNGGPGAMSVAAFTDAQGRAQAFYRLGTRAGAGNNKVEATAVGVTGEAIFVASASGTQASRINVDAGLNQTGATGQQLPFPFVAVVTDAGHNRLGNVPVMFTVRSGNGSFDGVSSKTTMSDSDGRALVTLTLGDEEGFENNSVEADFPGNADRSASFTASAKVAGLESETKISGVVLDNSNMPLAGVTVRLYQFHMGNVSNIPQSVATPVVTGEDGQFVISPAPVGAFKLVADGTTVQGSRSYPPVEYDIVTVAGQDNTVGLPIYLPVLDDVNRLCVSETTGGTLTLPSVPGFSFTVPAGSATFPGGARSGCITVTPVHSDKVPMVPGFGQQPRFVITIQPVGTAFNPPAQIQFPNVDGLQPRQVTEMYSYDHDLSTFVAIGTATVSEDGSVLRSDPGVGVLKAGWHCGGDPNSVGSAATCPECATCVGDQCQPDPAQAGAACDDKKLCTEPDRCTAGACVGEPIFLGDPRDDNTYTAAIKIPPEFLGKLNQAIQKIPRMQNFEFKTAQASAAGKFKNCCDEKSGFIEDGDWEGSGTFMISGSIDKFNIFGASQRAQTPFWGIIFTVDYNVGLYISFDLAVSAQGGYKKNLCSGKECLFGQVSLSTPLDGGGIVEGITCVETLWTTTQCAGLTGTVGTRAIFAAGMTYNKPSCGSGLGGFVGIEKIVAHIDFSVGGFGRPPEAKFSVSQEIWSGAKLTFP